MLSLYEGNINIKGKSIVGTTSPTYGYTYGANKSPFMLYPKNGTVKMLNKKAISAEQILNFTFKDFEKECIQFFSDPDCKTVQVTMDCDNLLGATKGYSDDCILCFCITVST